VPLAPGQRELLIKMLNSHHYNAPTEVDRQRVTQLAHDLMIDLEVTNPGIVPGFYEAVIADPVAGSTCSICGATQIPPISPGGRA